MKVKKNKNMDIKYSKKRLIKERKYKIKRNKNKQKKKFDEKNLSAAYLNIKEL